MDRLRRTLGTILALAVLATPTAFVASGANALQIAQPSVPSADPVPGPQRPGWAGQFAGPAR